MKKKYGIWALIVFFILSASIAMADHVTVPAAAFQGDTESEDFYCNGNYVMKTSTSGNLYAPVYLPHGAVIKNIRLLYWDDSSTSDVTATLWRTNMFTGQALSLFSVTTSGAVAAYQSLVDSTTAVVAKRIVYTNVLQYCVELQFNAADGANLRVYGVTIEY